MTSKSVFPFILEHRTEEPAMELKTVAGRVVPTCVVPLGRVLYRFLWWDQEKGHGRGPPPSPLE